MINIQSLKKSFNNETVLKDINLTISNGEMIALLGPSGAGKSTLLRCLNGFERPTSGVLTINGQSIPTKPKSLQEFRKNIGFIFQNFNLVNRMTVLDNALCGRLAHTSTVKSFLKIFSKEDHELAKYYLNKVGIYEYKDKRVDQLSGGQRQRVAIARSLIQQPTILLADEPVASLDPKTAHSILNLLQLLKEEENLTLVMTLHHVELAKEYAQRIIGLNHGVIKVDATSRLISVDQLYKLYDQNENSIVSERKGGELIASY
ncbi:TPA: phosphonate ABC transporter ATP-binding protein [Bacillus luti]|nr:phosphonate ABC transporter ATP-binding protein [Bacillus luti]HDR7796065.1 phosphonate ABC transporter ATP-binding protein [Bacillus luti]